jgi:hypothetical protein
MPPEVEMGDLELRYAHLSHRWTPAREERRRRLQEYIAEIQTEQEALEAARDRPDGPPLRIADRYAAGRPRGRPEESGTPQDDS